MSVTRPSSQVRDHAFRELTSLMFLCSGMVATATRTILENLDRIPNEDDRTKVAFVAFDTSLYFFSMPVSFY